jgi:phosphoenolpyruvate carboxykinase (GTP)
MTRRNRSIPLNKNDLLLRWVQKMAELTRPASIHRVDGSKEEYDQLCAEMVAAGMFVKLNEKLFPGCYYAGSDESDVARVEDRTFFCSFQKIAPAR